MSELRALLRMMYHNFASSAAAVLMLAVAIAAATATFSVADAALWQDLPYRDSRDLAVLVTRHANGQTNVSIPDFLTVRDGAAGTRVAAAGAFTPEYALTGFGDPRQIRGRVLSAEYFQTLGVPLTEGRDFKRSEEGPGAGYVAILAARLSNQLFRDRSALGSTIMLNGRAYTVVGILPPYRDPLGEVDIYVPYPFASNLPRRIRLLTPVVRLRNQNLSTFRNQVGVLTGNTGDPEAAGYRVDAVPFADHISAASRTSVSMLFAAASALLTIAVLNLTMLVAARIRQRNPEFAVRLALGASPATILRLASMESMVLIFGGAIVAVGLSRLVTPLLQNRFGAAIVNEVTVGPRTLLFTLTVAVIAVLVVTIASMAASREQPGAERRIVSSSLRAGRALVISQIAISLLLVVGSTTLAVSFSKLRQVHPGFRTSGLLTSRISLPAGQYNDAAKRARFWRTLIRDLGEKGIQTAITTELPLSGDDNPTNFTTRLNDGQAITTKLRSVSANYLEVMHIPLIEGRQLSDRDVPGAPRAVVINEKLALFLSRLGPPVGQMISYDAADTPTVVQVVGVVGNIRHERLNGEPKPEVYVPFEQTPLQTYSLVLDGPSTSADASRTLRATMDTIDRAQPFTDIVPLSNYIERNLAGSRFETGALSLFALVALLVASTGLYGLLTHLVTATRREWALRLVLGASPIQLRNIVLKQSLADALFGFGVGAALFFVVYRWFQGVFDGVSPWNPWLLAASGAVVSTTCVLSATIPALRALRISPAEALSE